MAIAFLIFSAGIVVSALAVVVLKNVFRASLMLVLCFFLVAGLFASLSADFLAAIQVLIYVGAISVLIILAIPGFGTVISGLVSDWARVIPSYYLTDTVNRVANYGAGWGDVDVNLAILAVISALVIWVSFC